jgi:prepilin-type N-terminal cleavage/methylation domain-containing protein
MMRRSIARLSARRQKRRANQGSRGFTLIELLTVVVVVGVVSTVAAMALGQLNRKSTVGAVSGRRNQDLENAISLVKAQYPGTTVNESILLTNGGAYEGPYLPSWPDNPASLRFLPRRGSAQHSVTGRFGDDVGHDARRRRAVQWTHRPARGDVLTATVRSTHHATSRAYRRTLTAVARSQRDENRCTEYHVRHADTLTIIHY